MDLVCIKGTVLWRFKTWDNLVHILLWCANAVKWPRTQVCVFGQNCILNLNDIQLSHGAIKGRGTMLFSAFRVIYTVNELDSHAKNGQSKKKKKKH